MNSLKTFFPILALGLCTISCNNPKVTESQPENTAGSKNQVLETMLNRKSVREYTEQEISQEDIRSLMKAGMSAPSSKDRRPWQFIVVSDKEILQKLGENLKNAGMLKNANKAIIVCGDTVLSDNCWFLDCSAASQNILLAAESMGIGAVWTAVYPYEDRAAVVNEIFQLPENIKALSIIPLGYPSVQNDPKDKFDETRIHLNRW